MPERGKSSQSDTPFSIKSNLINPGREGVSLMDKRLLTISEFAEALGVCRTTARGIASNYPESLVRRGKLGDLVYVKSDLVEELTRSKSISEKSEGVKNG